MQRQSRWPEKLMVSVSTETKQALEEIAQERASSVSAVIRQAVERYVAEERDHAGA